MLLSGLRSDSGAPAGEAGTSQSCSAPYQSPRLGPGTNDRSARPVRPRLVSGPDGRGPTDGEWGAVAVAVGGFIVVGVIASWLAAAGVIAAIQQAVIGGLMLYGVGCVIWLVAQKLRRRR